MASTKNTKPQTAVVKAGADRPAIPALTEVKAAFAEDTKARAAIVLAYMANGFSQRAMIAHAVKANRGLPVKGFNNGGISRTVPVVKASIKLGEAFPKATDAQREAMLDALATVANYGGNAGVTTAVELALKATTAPAALTSLKAAVKAEGQTAIAALKSAPKARGTKGPKAGRTTGDDDTTEPEGPSVTITRKGGADSLSAAGIGTLIAALSTRLAAVDAIDVATADALSDLVSAADAIIARHYGIAEDAEVDAITVDA